MPFVPDKKCDVFVSYATINNPDQDPWVTQFIDVLRIRLAEAVGRSKDAVWMDHFLRANEPFDEQLREQVLGAATMVVVLSRGWLNSPWCRRELEVFVSASGTTRSV